MDCIAVGTVRIAASSSEEYTSHHSTGAKENKVARVRKELQRRVRDHLGESLRAGSWRRDLIGTSTHDRHRDRDFAKALWCEHRPQPRRHGEDSADARVTIGIASRAVAFAEIGI